MTHRPIDKTTDISDKGFISDVEGTPIVKTTKISDKGLSLSSKAMTLTYHPIDKTTDNSDNGFLSDGIIINDLDYIFFT